MLTCRIAQPVPVIAIRVILRPSQVYMAILSFRNTHRVVDGLCALSLYPLSLMVVAGLESIGWD